MLFREKRWKKENKKGGNESGKNGEKWRTATRTLV
jgi:hypothetical protein